MRIVQELVLTREAFNARLELENGEQRALYGIRVTIEIRKTGDPSRQLANQRFSIGMYIYIYIVSPIFIALCRCEDMRRLVLKIIVRNIGLILV